MFLYIYIYIYIYIAVRSIQHGKVVGLDEIPAEVWKLGEFQEIILLLQ